MGYSMSDLLQLVVSEGSSDLHIRVGTPPTIRVHGILHRVEGPVLQPEDTEELMRSITSEDHIQGVRERGGADFGFAFGDMARFRVSVFKEKGNFGLVLRQIPNKLLTMEQIGIPPSARSNTPATRSAFAGTDAKKATRSRAKEPPNSSTTAQSRSSSPTTMVTKPSSKPNG